MKKIKRYKSLFPEKVCWKTKDNGKKEAYSDNEDMKIVFQSGNPIEVPKTEEDKEKEKKKYEDIELKEVFSVEKPEKEPGFIITKTVGRDPNNPKRIVKGWKKVRVKKTTGKDRAIRKKAAKKAARTKKAQGAGAKKKIQKKRAKTLKVKKKMGLN